MPVLFVVGGGLFGSLAAAYARSKGIEAVVFDPGLRGAASPAAAGLFREAWLPAKLRHHYHRALPILDRLCAIQSISLRRDDGDLETALFAQPAAILEANPLRDVVTTVGDGWLECGGRRLQGWIYVAAGVWSGQFLPGLTVSSKAGAAFAFAGEREGRIHTLGPGRQALVFVRDRGRTHFSDGTAECEYTHEHDRQSLQQAEQLGLTGSPLCRYWGRRPYTAGGPLFHQMGARTWLATGGRKIGTVVAASFARRLIEDELH